MPIFVVKLQVLMLMLNIIQRCFIEQLPFLVFPLLRSSKARDYICTYPLELTSEPIEISTHQSQEVSITSEL